MPIPRAHEHHCPAPDCPNGTLYCCCNYEHEPDWCEDHEEERQEAIRAEEEADYMTDLELPRSGWGRP